MAVGAWGQTKGPDATGRTGSRPKQVRWAKHIKGVTGRTLVQGVVDAIVGMKVRGK